MASGGSLISSPADFTEREFWDRFFKERGGRPFEWYGEWDDLRELLAQHCGLSPTRIPAPKILVPGCGNSELSAKMYDAGFQHIVNVDFSKVVIADMLRQHMRTRPQMLWRVMDMTEMQFSDSSFDAILDKGGLDALLGEPGQDATPATRFLSEVKRVLRFNGMYICVTLAQIHIVELLLSNFRHGWRVAIHRMPLLCEAAPSELKPFLIVATKENSSTCSVVTWSFDPYLFNEEYKFQMHGLKEAVDEENKLRTSTIMGENLEQKEKHLYSSFENMSPGRRSEVVLGGQGLSRSSYAVVVLDAPEGSGPFKYDCAVFLVPKGRAHEWLFSSKEGQWQVVESAKAGRLIMVFLDINFYSGSMDDIQVDLSPLVKNLLPVDCRRSVGVPYLMSGDGVAKRLIREQIDSPMTGVMLVEDVVLSEESISNRHPDSKQKFFRRLVFRRNPNLIQSEALLIKVPMKSEERAKHDGGRRHKSTKKKTRIDKDQLCGANDDLKVDHSFLASAYHGGMVAGLALIISNLENWISTQQPVRAAVVGLGAGLLPMFLHDHVPFQKVQVMELDPVVGELAKRHFGFTEDERMELCIGDGIIILKEITRAGLNFKIDTDCSVSNETLGHAEPDRGCDKQSREACCSSTKSLSDDPYTRQHCLVDQLAEGVNKWHLSNGQSQIDGFHVIFIDADSEDPSTGLSCPPKEFLQESFLRLARAALHDGGMLVINIVSRATELHATVPARLKKVFDEVYGLDIEEDVNRVLFALAHKSGIKEKEDILKAVAALERMVTSFAPWGNGPNLRHIAVNLNRY